MLIGLPDGTTCSVQTAPASLRMVHRLHPQAVQFTACGVSVALSGRAIRSAGGLQQAALLAGEAVAEALTRDALPLLLLLGYAGFRDLPGREMVERLVDLGAMLSCRPRRSHRLLTVREVRTQAAAALAACTAPVPIVDGRWNAARFLLLLGEAAWGLEGESARFWGTMAVTEEPGSTAMTTRIALAILAGSMMTNAHRQRLPIPAGRSAQPVDIWLDALVLRMAPVILAPLLVPEGLGVHGMTPLEHNTDPWYLSLSLEQGRILDALARVLLAECPRPVPRLVARLCDIAVPEDVFPHLAVWQIARLRVEPHMGGMGVAVLDAEGRTMAMAWWDATATSSTRTPVTIPAAAWSLLHPVLAGIWHDLCADAVVLEDDVPREERGGHAPSGRRTPGRTTRVLPAVRRPVRATWADAIDRETIRRAAAVSAEYRRLPTGWQERETHADVARRRIRTAQRAEQYGYPAPPPGFTFVRPHTRGGAAEPTAGASVTVRARGLFTLALGMRQVPPATAAEWNGAGDE